MRITNDTDLQAGIVPASYDTHKRSRYRLLIVLAALLAVVFCFSLTIAEEEPMIVDHGSCGKNVTWQLDSNGQLTISGTGRMKDYCTHYDNAGPSASFLHHPWFSYRSNLFSVEIKSDVTSIGSGAFYSCSNLTSITIPDTVTAIGDCAFYDCSSLTSVTIPESVTSIGSCAFNGCNKLKHVMFLDTGALNSIASDAFSYLYPTLYCYEYSYADSWARNKGLDVVLLDNMDLTKARSIAFRAPHVPQAMQPGESRDLLVDVFPGQAEAYLTWESSDPDIASVDSNGKVTAHAQGTVTITASSGDVSASTTFTSRIPLTDFAFDREEYYVEVRKSLPLGIVKRRETPWRRSAGVLQTVPSRRLATES